MAPIKTLTPTPTPNGTANASIQSSRPGTQVVVEEGPVWLAKLAFQPPGWLFDVIWLVVVLVGILTALGLYRNGIDEDVIREMSLAALTVVGAIVAANLVGSVGWLPWAAKAIIAGGSGWVAARGIERGADRIGTNA